MGTCKCSGSVYKEIVHIKSEQDACISFLLAIIYTPHLRRQPSCTIYLPISLTASLEIWAGNACFSYALSSSFRTYRAVMGVN